MTDFIHNIDFENAPVISKWMLERGGISVWSSINLSNPGASWTTPAHNEDGTPAGKPSWQAASEPSLTITDPDKVGVITPIELQRFHISVRRGELSLKLTDASSDKLRKRLAHWRERRADGNVTYRFDYGNQEAVILGADKIISLSEWRKS
jgi:hypothetical protein